MAAGRRPGKAGTRAEIVAAARDVFTANGFNQATLRGIARRASVDPALVHHYFTDKSQLFIETMQLPADPRQVQLAASAPGSSPSGERVVERFLAQWEEGSDGTGSASFVMMAQAVAASAEVANAVREFLAERLPLHGPADENPEMWRRRRALVSAHLFGLGWNRYVMRVEPLASASRAEVARWAGPVIDHYFRGSPPGAGVGVGPSPAL